MQLLPLLPTFRFGNSNTCTYCGDRPQALDHVIPVSFQRTHDGARKSSNGPLTWSCNLCNGLLGANWFDSFDDRCRFVVDRLEYVTAPLEWQSFELAHLDYGLRQGIKYENNRRKWLRYRAQWYGSRDYWLNLENLQWLLESCKTDNPGWTFLAGYFRHSTKGVQQTLYASV